MFNQFDPDSEYNFRCAKEDFGTDFRLQDEAFMQKQLDCVLNKGPCDELGASIKRKLLLSNTI